MRPYAMLFVIFCVMLSCASFQTSTFNTGIIGTVFTFLHSTLNLFLSRAEKWTREKFKNKRTTYQHYQVLRIVPKNKHQLKIVEELGDGIDFWRHPAKKKPTDILVPPEELEDTVECLQENEIDYEVLIRNVQKAIVYENPKMTREQREILLAKRGHPFTWDRYHRYSDIVRYLQFLLYTYPNLVELITIGYSTRGLPLKVVRVSSDKSSYKHLRTKPSIWIDGGMSPREWVSSSAVLYIIKELVEKHSKNSQLVESGDWYLMPVANPDGYEYAHTKDRLWTKTRSSHWPASIAGKLFQGSCIGTNLNSNFDINWGDDNELQDPCSPNYKGPVPFSEPESKSIANFLVTQNETMQMFLTLHAYSQTLSLPDNDAGSDYKGMVDMAKTAVTAISKESGVVYTVSQDTRPGSPEEWAMKVAGVAYSYRIELRDKDNYGYLLPANLIVPTSREIFVAVKAIAKLIF